MMSTSPSLTRTSCLRSRSIVASALVAALGLPGMPLPAGAQERRANETNRTEIIRPPAVSIDFDGGDALEYIEAVRDAAGEVNIVVKGPVEEIELPEIQLKGVSVESALQLLDGERVRTDEEHIILRVDEIEGEVVKQEEGGMAARYTTVGRLPSIYVVAAHVQPLQDRDPSPLKTDSRIWALSEILQYIPADDVLGAVDVAVPLATDDDEPEIEIRFHEETGILIARGPHSVLNTIEETIEELHRTARVREHEEAEQRDHERREEQSRREMDEMKREFARAQEQMQRERERMQHEFQQQREQMQMEAERLRHELERERVDAEARRRDGERHVEQLERQLARLNEELAQRENRIHELEQLVSRLRQELEGKKPEQ